jgi:type IV pilus assembly protein PilA
MARRVQTFPTVAERGSRGFTLIELMIVVIIVGILATLAVVGYRKLMNSSHVSEATNMVQSIRVAQEAYHAETQQYLSASTGFPTGDGPAGNIFYPIASGTPTYELLTAWGGACANCTSATVWNSLPVHVDGPLLFGYATVANGGPLNLNPTASITIGGNATTITNPGTDWFAIAAEADLDGTAGTVTHVFGFSMSNQIFVANEGL